MGMAYANNLVYIVCFYLTTMGLVLAKITNDHADHVLIEKVYIKEAFAEPNQVLYVSIRNTTKRPLKQIELRIAKQKSIIKTDLKPDESQTHELLWTPTKRGPQKAPAIRIQSSYPAGLFEAWKVLKPAEEITIFPERKGLKEFPQASFASHQDSVGVLREIRDYQAGDSPKRIHWRSLAKAGQLRTLVHEGNEGQVCHLSWQQVQHMPLEDRLSQLALWISLAEAQGSPWKLKLPYMDYISQNVNAAKTVLTELANWK